MSLGNTERWLYQQNAHWPWTPQDNCAPGPRLWEFSNSLTDTRISSEVNSDNKWLALTTEMNIIPIKCTSYLSLIRPDRKLAPTTILPCTPTFCLAAASRMASGHTNGPLALTGTFVNSPLTFPTPPPHTAGSSLSSTLPQPSVHTTGRIHSIEKQSGRDGSTCSAVL